MDYFAYILRCADGALYVGHTDGLDERIQRHNRGEGAAFTARRRPVVLVYAEPHSSRRAAAAREKQLKRWTRQKKETLIGGDLVLLNRL